MTTYPPAGTSAGYWYADNYPGTTWDEGDLEKVVLHTTEGTSWPSYSGGAIAPNVTGCPNMARRVVEWRAHFPARMSSRALRNLSGGVETNTDRAYQLELVGTCDPANAESWAGKGRVFAGVDYLFWPDAPSWALDDLAAHLAWCSTELGIPLVAPASWLPYSDRQPSSYGNSPARLSGSAYNAFRGVLGHQHVPENLHGDPGNLDMTTVLAVARRIANPAPVPPIPAPTPRGIDMDAIVKTTDGRHFLIARHPSTLAPVKVALPDEQAVWLSRWGTPVVPVASSVADLFPTYVAAVA